MRSTNSKRSFITTSQSYLSNLRHWKWIDDSNKSTPVLSGSCLQSCMQCLSAASKSPAWYSRWANSANPWKESIRFVGSGESPKHLRGENKKLENGNKTEETKQKQNECEEKKKQPNNQNQTKKVLQTKGWKRLRLHKTIQQVAVCALTSSGPSCCCGISSVNVWKQKQPLQLHNFTSFSS